MRFPVLGDLLVAVAVVADQVDVADLRRLAFLDVQGQVDAVAVEPLHARADLDAVLAAVVVLAVQFLGDAIQVEAVEGLAFGQADVLEALQQVFGLQVLVADQGQLVDGGPFDHGDHQDAALVVQAHVLEEAGLVQRAQRLGGLGGVEGVAALDGQVGEHGACADALQAVDADVADRERCERRLRPGRQRERRGQGKCEQAAGQGSGHSEHPVAEHGAGCMRSGTSGGGAMRHDTRRRMSL